MDEKDWQEVRELRLEHIGTRKGTALGDLIAEEQRLAKVRQIISDYSSSPTTKVIGFDKIDRLLEEEDKV